MTSKRKIGQIIEHDGDTWEITGLGIERDEMVYAHLSSTTRGTRQKNGFYPVQSCDFIEANLND